MFKKIASFLAAGFIAAAFTSTAQADYQCRLANGQMAMCRGGMVQPIQRRPFFGIGMPMVIRPLAPQAVYQTQPGYVGQGYAEQRGGYVAGGVARGKATCSHGGGYDEDSRNCVVSGAPTTAIADDQNCKNKPTGTPFEVEIPGPHGERMVDHRVCG